LRGALSYPRFTLRGMANEWARARRAGQKAALREVAVALGGDEMAYRFAGVLLRNAHVGSVAELMELTDPESVPGIGVTAAARIRRVQAQAATPV